jgi:hypothetical protein
MDNPINDVKPKRGRKPKVQAPIVSAFVAPVVSVPPPVLGVGERLKQSRVAAAAKPVNLLGPKVCKSCHKTKPVSEYSKSGTHHRKTCKTCDIALRNMKKSLRTAI